VTQRDANRKICRDAASIANDMVSWNDPDAGRIFRAEDRISRTGIGLSIEPLYWRMQDDDTKRHLRIMASEAMKASVKKNQKLVIGLLIAKELGNG
jgi:hypothetical protein